MKCGRQADGCPRWLQNIRLALPWDFRSVLGRNSVHIISQLTALVGVSYTMVQKRWKMNCSLAWLQNDLLLYLKGGSVGPNLPDLQLKAGLKKMLFLCLWDHGHFFYVWSAGVYTKEYSQRFHTDILPTIPRDLEKLDSLQDIIYNILQGLCCFRRKSDRFNIFKFSKSGRIRAM